MLKDGMSGYVELVSSAAVTAELPCVLSSIGSSGLVWSTTKELV